MSNEETKKPIGRPFQKGTSGNPGGRAKGYERRIRELVDGEVVEHKTRGTIPAFDAIILQAIADAVAGDRYAREFIADRLCGKAKQTVEIQGEADPAPAIDWSKVPIEMRRSLFAALLEPDAATEH